MPKTIRIYDIDGTITRPGHDLWYITTKSLAKDPIAFDAEVNNWKQRIGLGGCPYTESLKMMKTGVDLLQDAVGESSIRRQAKQISADLIANHNVFEGAISHIKESIKQGFQVVFATTNYTPGAEGFLSALQDADLLTDLESHSIVLSGSQVNWSNGDVTHFNMDIGKAKGICLALDCSRAALKPLIDSSYGDDPDGNDREILRMAPTSYVIRNPKNANVALERNMTICDWEDINNLHPQEPIPN